MRRKLVLSALAVAIAIPSMAAAQQTCQQERTDHKVIGTVIGAGLGALLGNAIGEHGGKPGGTIIGGVAGGVVGNQVAGSGTNCNTQGYYDSDGRWHQAAAAGGYYDANGRWVSTAAAGYYDSNGRWVANGADGYYDSTGRWVAAAQGAPSYREDGMWSGAPNDTRSREDWLESRIRQARDTGRLPDDGANRALSELRAIRSQDQEYRQYGNGDLDSRQRGYIEARLDDLRRSLPS